MSEDFITVRQAADMLGVSVWTIHRMIREDVLRAIRPTERTTRVRKADIDAILEDA